MPKKHDFIEVLKAYNEKYNHNHSLLPQIRNAIISHSIADGTYYVTYIDVHGPLGEYKKCLAEFVAQYISRSIPISDIIAIVQLREDKSTKLKIEIWSSNKIRYAYMYDNYAGKDIGILGKSCMRGKDMQKSLNFYIKNNVRIVVAVDSKNKIHARALLWDNIKNTRNKKICTYLDRVYSRSDTFLHLFYNLAEENKWELYGSTSAGKARTGYYKDKLNMAGMCHFPYTDTFRYLYHKDNIVASSRIPSKVKHKDDISMLTTTGGGGYCPHLDPDRVMEVITSDFISKKDAVFVKRYNGYVLKGHIINIDGAYYSQRDGHIIKTELDGYILKEMSTHEVITNDLICKILAVHSSIYNGYVHKSNAVIIEDDIYHKKDKNVICFNCKWYHVLQCFVNYDRQEVNKELAKQLPSPLNLALFHHTPYWMIAEVFSPRVDGLIPKDCAMIAYDIIYNPIIDDIEYQEVYCTSRVGLVQLVTGELIVNSSSNKKYLKKFNNKYYIRRTVRLSNDITVTLPNTEQTFKLPNKKQLMLF